MVGASAGGVEALKVFIKNLPTNLQAAVMVVLHIPEHSRSRLAEILQRESNLEIKAAANGEAVTPNKVYIAGAGRHLLVEDGTVVLGRGPKENRFRPSIDALFRSAAYSYRERVIGILLSGSMDDGNSGLWTIKRLGGLTIVQEESETIFPQMIMNAKHYVDIDHEVPVANMGDLLSQLTSEPPANGEELSEDDAKLMELEVIVAERDNAFELHLLEYGEFTPITCPECHGALVQLKQGPIIRFRCHTGHAFTISSLLTGVSDSINNQLWQAMKGMEENAILLETLGRHFEESDHQDISGSYVAKADEFKQKARLVHSMIENQEQVSGDPEEFREGGVSGEED